MSSSTLYRFISSGKGIYEAVDLDCPRSDARRNQKPDGSWLPKIGTQYPGSTSFWTEAGLKKYLESGLQDWHRRVVNNPVFVQILQESPKVLYSDNFQVICKPEDAAHQKLLSWENFAIQKATDKMIDKVIGYVTRTKDSFKELLVFDHDKHWSEAGTQVPAGTVDPGESLEAALFRELEEESGLTGFRVKNKIDEYVFYRIPHQQFNRRHIFELEPIAALPDKWTHVVTGEGEDSEMNFHYYWIPLADAGIRLSGGMGDSVKKLLLQHGV